MCFPFFLYVTLAIGNIFKIQISNYKQFVSFSITFREKKGNQHIRKHKNSTITLVVMCEFEKKDILEKALGKNETNN